MGPPSYTTPQQPTINESYILQFYSNQKRFSCQKCKGKKISGEKAKVNYLVKYFLSVQSFPILLTLKKCAVTSSNLKEKENLHDVTKHAEKDLQNFREALIFILRQNCFTVMGSISRIKFCHFAVLSKYFCCVF